MSNIIWDAVKEILENNTLKTFAIYASRVPPETKPYGGLMVQFPHSSDTESDSASDSGSITPISNFTRARQEGALLARQENKAMILPGFTDRIRGRFLDTDTALAFGGNSGIKVLATITHLSCIALQHWGNGAGKWRSALESLGVSVNVFRAQNYLMYSADLLDAVYVLIDYAFRIFNKIRYFTTVNETNLRRRPMSLKTEWPYIGWIRLEKDDTYAINS